MVKSELSGLAQTVTGPIDPVTLGPTMTHEHLLIEFSTMFVEPEEASQKFLAHQKLSMENLGWISYNWTSNLDNLLLLDEKAAIEEAMNYRLEGGGTIVDATTLGIGRDPLALARISRATDLNVVMGAGWYVDQVHPDDMDSRTETELADQMINEITLGVGDTGVKAGIIGEIGCSFPLADNERKVLRAAGRAQAMTGAPLLIHPGRSETAPLEIASVLDEVGTDLSHTIIGHLDRTIFERATLKALAETGVYLEWDLFGREQHYYWANEAIDMPHDGQRIADIAWTIEQGYGDRIVVAHDICTKDRLLKYGGHGYFYLLARIVPRMRYRGYTEEQIDAILVGNPASALTFRTPTAG